MTTFLNVALVAYTVLQAVMYIAVAVKDGKETKDNSLQQKPLQFQSI